MKDPTIPNPENRKKIMFYDSEKRQADLRIRLRYDGLNQSHFFRAIISGYLDKDSDIMSYLDKYRGKYQIQGINKRAASKRLRKKGKGIEQAYALAENEISDIFDMMEEEHPDL